jgi:hypothetical protein
MTFGTKEMGSQPAGEVSSEAACFGIRMEQKITDVGLREAAAALAIRVFGRTHGAKAQAPKQTGEKREPDEPGSRRKQDRQDEGGAKDDLRCERALHP